MDSERATLEELAKEYDTAMRQAEALIFFVRDAELQAKEVISLSALKSRIRGFKNGARQAGDEGAANTLFHLQCGLNAMISLLKMWIELKKGDCYSAWDRLIDAQEYVSIALRAAEGGTGLHELRKHLTRAERVIFPGCRVYNSVGAVIRGGKCTICGLPFNGCEHVEGLVYWGRLCVRAQPEIVDIDHVSMVDEPRDRRCVITEVSTDDGYYRDSMTWVKTRKIEDGNEGSTMRVTGKVFCGHSIEID